MRFSIKFSMKGTDEEVLDQVLDGGKERTMKFSIKFRMRERNDEVLD